MIDRAILAVNKLKVLSEINLISLSLFQVTGEVLHDVQDKDLRHARERRMQSHSLIGNLSVWTQSLSRNTTGPWVED
jgi:hypothetical protein